MFIAALFTRARIWKQARCPLAEEWIRKLWYIWYILYHILYILYTVEYYSAIKRNVFEPVLKRQMDLSLSYRVM